jgi:hypothetical protein
MYVYNFDTGAVTGITSSNTIMVTTVVDRSVSQYGDHMTLSVDVD